MSGLTTLQAEAIPLDNTARALLSKLEHTITDFKKETFYF
jgi:hypothetical protein